MTGYRSKKASSQQPASPTSQASDGSEIQSGFAYLLYTRLIFCSISQLVLCPNFDRLLTTEADAGTQDSNADLLEVQVSGKSARSARRFQGRPSLCHLKSAPASALLAAAEQAVADHSVHSPPADYLTSSSYGSSNSSHTTNVRYPRSQSHLDIPRQGSEAITPTSVPSTSGRQEPVPLARANSRGLPLASPFASPYAAPAVQQAAPAQQAPISPSGQVRAAPATASSTSTLSRRLSRKISGNKMISQSQGLPARDGEFVLPPETAQFARAAPSSSDELEVCFSGKSARAFRSMARPANLQPVTAH